MLNVRILHEKHKLSGYVTCKAVYSGTPLFWTPWDQKGLSFLLRFEDVLCDYSIANHLVPVVCDHIRGVSSIQGSGIDLGVRSTVPH